MKRLRCWFCLLLLFVLRGNAVELFDIKNMDVVKSVTLELSSDKLRPGEFTRTHCVLEHRVFLCPHSVTVCFVI